MLSCLSYSYISHITLYMMLKKSYFFKRNYSNIYCFNPSKCNLDFKTHSLNLYSDTFSTFFVFTRCFMFWQHDLKYWISNCDLTVNILKSTPHLKASCLKTLWSLIINFSIPYVEIFFSEQIPIFCSYGNKVQYLILSFYFYSLNLNSRNHIFSWIT